MFTPILCPHCTAIVLVPDRGLITTRTSALYRCPSCRAVVHEQRGHPEAPPPGPPISRDDLLTLHEHLEDRDRAA